MKFCFLIYFLKRNKNKEWLELYTWLSWKVIIVKLGKPSANSFIPSTRSCSFLSIFTKLFLVFQHFSYTPWKLRKYLSGIVTCLYIPQYHFHLLRRMRCFHRSVHLALTSRVYTTCHISNTRDSVSSGYPNTKKGIKNTTGSGVMVTRFEMFG